MADDGLLLNFSLGGDTVLKPTTTKVKGGTWRDRLSARKIAASRKTPRDPNAPREENENATRNPNRIAVSSSRPVKRQRTDDHSTPSSSSHNHSQNQQNQSARPFVSSLFSKNPLPQTAEEPATKDGEGEDVDAKPTNAPLIDGLDTFTNLGLSESLAAHLLTKLGVKAPTAIQKASISQLLKEESDAFIQAETGSGKTMAYLLPLVQRLMTLSRASAQQDGTVVGKSASGEPIVHRDSGLFAIVLAPTRELCKQIAVVLEGLLRCAHWIVAGTVIGGEKKKSEKARLRKGLNILVATPGRLADHLENTQALDVSNVRWLVLDEGDRLMELGFEKELQGIIQKLDARQRPSRIPGVPAKRTTILCSATLKMNVQKLGEISLKDAIHVQADPADEDPEAKKNKDEDDAFRVPAQLKQSYAIVAAKLRLVSLTALMRRTFMRKGSVMKAIVFVSCADSVDFHFELFTRKLKAEEEADKKKETDSDDSGSDSSDEDGEDEPKEKKNSKAANEHGTVALATAFSNPTNPVMLHRLHGSLPQHVRTATLGAFARNREASVLICTDVASRGLDLPNVDLVVEYDPAFSAEDHLHRIGRTARLGRDGRALLFLMPGCEEQYVDILKRGYRDGGKALTRLNADDILKRGFGGNVQSQSKDWEVKTTDWQMDVERWAVDNPQYLEMARRAYQSHIRAYATHIASERHMFNIKELHLGHLAKSFALRDRPSKINVPGLRQSSSDAKKDFKAARTNAAGGQKRKAGDDDGDRPATAVSLAAQKMRAKMKEHMAGANEFNIA
ncbi:putative ATP-dependent RNA helicase [Aspergillus homomorphus CBS 101889]|uniref:ATP-dependent RNA helicase n=1 Tax=Aspergillus homomorphus (strain CBS 101889) TaxID=1450537 RepID=A0A395I1M0_ASPHC|nr:putative ATP dependent RNA helicase [Aspergillus homomorphus CBS 101889]RAL14082.1 putative ATP dependent RNA helicase [Aspergillus homomorphus CBS 101889]